MAYSNKIRSGQNRLLNTYGVRDLREVLDMKRSEKESGQSQSTSLSPPPPSDPGFNYLKDPSREVNDKRQPQFHNKQYHKTKNFTQNWQNRPKFQQRQRSQQHHNQQQEHQQNQDIENPYNIKIEFSTTSGEHTYTLDENVKLPTIKHVPDRKIPPPIRRNNYDYQRGGRKRYVQQTRQYRSSNNSNRQRNTDKNDKIGDESLTNDKQQGASDSSIVQQLENIDLNQDEAGVEDEEDGGGEVVDEEEEEVVEDEQEAADEAEEKGEHQKQIDANTEKAVEKHEKDNKENDATIEKANSK